MFLVGAVAFDAVDVAVWEIAFVEEVAFVGFHAGVEPPEVAVELGGA